MRTFVILLALAMVQGTAAQVLVGEDPSGDSSNQIAPGADVGAVITNDRTDILSVTMAEDGNDLLVKLNIVTAPAGTSGYMYRVVFDVGETRYFTCFAVQWTAGDAQATQENIFGCSRFVSNTQVGPATTAAGVVVGDADISWPVAGSEIGGASLADITEVHADTWFRGASNCCVGSTTQTQYLWNQADRGPDTGRWALETMAAAASGLNATLHTNHTTADEDGAAFVLNLNATGNGNITFSLDGNWTAVGLNPIPVNGSFVGEQPFSIHPPQNLANGTYILGLNVTFMETSHLLDLVVDLTRSPASNETTTPADEDEGNESQEVKDTPVPFWIPVAAIALARVKRSPSQ